MNHDIIPIIIFYMKDVILALNLGYISIAKNMRIENSINIERNLFYEKNYDMLDKCYIHYEICIPSVEIVDYVIKDFDYDGFEYLKLCYKWTKAQKRRMKELVEKTWDVNMIDVFYPWYKTEGTFNYNFKYINHCGFFNFINPSQLKINDKYEQNRVASIIKKDPKSIEKFKEIIPLTNYCANDLFPDEIPSQESINYLMKNGIIFDEKYQKKILLTRNLLWISQIVFSRPFSMVPLIKGYTEVIDMLIQLHYRLPHDFLTRIVKEGDKHLFFYIVEKYERLLNKNDLETMDILFDRGDIDSVEHLHHFGFQSSFRVKCFLNYKGIDNDSSIFRMRLR